MKKPQKNKLIWLFSGTSDGNKIASDLISKNFQLKVFVASEYGKSIATKIIPSEIVETGRLTEKEIFERGKMDIPQQVIDATHPFAIEISKNLMSFCQTSQIPYIRYERPEDDIAGDKIYFVDNIEAAAEKARTLGNRILLTLGSKNIDPFLSEAMRGRIFIRMLPDPDLIQQLLSKGVEPDRIIAIQGPFSIAFNQFMMNDRNIDCLVTKSSGKEGGVPEKIAAANLLGASTILIKRPLMRFPVLFSEKHEVLDYLVKTSH